jgi:hypothetical protein
MKKKISFDKLDEKTMDEIYQKTIKNPQFQEKVKETNRLFRTIQLPTVPQTKS